MQPTGQGSQGIAKDSPRQTRLILKTAKEIAAKKRKRRKNRGLCSLKARTEIHPTGESVTLSKNGRMFLVLRLLRFFAANPIPAFRLICRLGGFSELKPFQSGRTRIPVLRLVGHPKPRDAVLWYLPGKSCSRRYPALAVRRGSCRVSMCITPGG